MDVDDPLLHQKANADWHRLAVEEGLFREEDPRFLLASPFEPWVCVELRAPWDLMGEGAAGPLGSAYCRPEFVMLSLDGSVLLGGTTNQYSVSTVVVRTPHRSQVLRRAAEYMAESDSDFYLPRERADARRWLDDHPLSEG
ncbi:hypothetical protein [Streptomyces soliscabiei]|uniref:hypothetical protein n=1 Tax=Streptomyces soliscabiei TaxID=588897 RepID=UPI0029A456FD|nr:hypothetical protein [Streptomyces sp. NY05-11A]MDX2678379.1 hypothetical protein [Streptomyces sp. NY05-11A]